MTSEEAVRLTRAHIEAQFPKTCTNCGAAFASLHDYLMKTDHKGQPVSRDEEKGDFAPKEPIGVFSYAVCACGTTLAITSAGMSLTTLWKLMSWARSEANRRGITWGELLSWVRDEIDRQVLAS